MGSNRWEAAQELLRLHDRMNRIFGLSTDDVGGDQIMQGSWTPACDILETRDALILRAELPGVRREDIDISLEAGVLTLKGHRSLEKETEERSYHRVERSYGNFVRSFTLPRSVDAEKIAATYVDGVLEIRMPRREETKPRSIKVSVGGGSIDTSSSSQ
jgi:HSP20 family protein